MKPSHITWSRNFSDSDIPSFENTSLSNSTIGVERETLGVTVQDLQQLMQFNFPGNMNFSQLQTVDSDLVDQILTEFFYDSAVDNIQFMDLYLNSMVTHDITNYNHMLCYLQLNSHIFSSNMAIVPVELFDIMGGFLLIVSLSLPEVTSLAHYHGAFDFILTFHQTNLESIAHANYTSVTNTIEANLCENTVLESVNGLHLTRDLFLNEVDEVVSIKVNQLNSSSLYAAYENFIFLWKSGITLFISSVGIGLVYNFFPVNIQVSGEVVEQTVLSTINEAPKIAEVFYFSISNIILSIPLDFTYSWVGLL